MDGAEIRWERLWLGGSEKSEGSWPRGQEEFAFPETQSRLGSWGMVHGRSIKLPL